MIKESFKNEVVVVTGASAGIGRAIAESFARQGAKLALIGTSAQRGAEVLQSVQALGAEGAFFNVDVADAQAVEKVGIEIQETLGIPYALINNAGITKDQLLMRMSEEEWDRVMEVNVKSCFNFARYFVRSMMKNKRGRIINMSSVVGVNGNAGQVNYAASKAAIIGFTKALAKELSGRNILVNCVAPGFIETAMTEGLSQGVKEKILTSIPLGRMGSAQEVADLVLFLASPHATYITGQVIAVDGGMAM